MIRRRRAALLRVAGEPSSLPRMHVVDLRSHQGSRAAGWPLISPPLERAMDTALQRGGRALLWLNRLGFATRVQCHQCGHVLQCKRCTAPLTFFSRRRELRCRYCATSQPAIAVCPQCRQGSLLYRGRGVEKAASEVARKFPTAALRIYDRRASAADDAVRRSGAGSGQWNGYARLVAHAASKVRRSPATRPAGKPRKGGDFFLPRRIMTRDRRPRVG